MNGGSVTNRGAITPTFDGAVELSDGEWLTFWGYDSDNTAIASIPRQTSGVTRNHFIGSGLSADAQDLLPVLFVGGSSRGVIALFTDGQEVKWELQGGSGGGVAVTDYDVPPDEDTLLAFSGFVVKQHPATMYKYKSFEPLTVEQIQAIRFGKVTLNNAGLYIDRQETVRHTEEPNDDIPGLPHWYPRDMASRIEGGSIQAHADEGRISRFYVEGIEREIARSILFSVPDASVTIFPENFAEYDIAQAGEGMARTQNISADGYIVAMTAEKYTDPRSAFIRTGRVWLWRKNDADDGTYTTTAQLSSLDIPDSSWEPDADKMFFGRCVAPTPDGTVLFVTSKRGPGIAAYRIDPLGIPTYWKTITWPEYTSRPQGERGHECRFSADGRFFLLSTGGYPGAATVPSTWHMLYSDDGWETVEIRQAGIERPDVVPAEDDSFQTLDFARDGSAFGIGCGEINRAYVYRTEDEWLTFTAHQMDTPSGITAYDYRDETPSAEKVLFAQSVAIGQDGFRAVFSAPMQNWDYVGGAPLANAANVQASQIGTVWYYTWDQDAEEYEGPFQLLPPTDLTEYTPPIRYGSSVRFNGPGNRLHAACSTIPLIWLFGIHGEEFKKVGEILTGLPSGSAETSWLLTEDRFIIGAINSDNGDKANVGSFASVKYEETP